MTYSVYQHWDPLEVCAVGRSYSPQFYSFIKDANIRNVFERIAEETEEDFQKLIALLESFNVKVVRPDVQDDYKFYLDSNGKILPPPMTPRDYTIMLGEDFYFKSEASPHELWNNIRGDNWPLSLPPESEFNLLPKFIQDELTVLGVEQFYPKISSIDTFTWGKMLDLIGSAGNSIHKYVPTSLIDANSAMYTRVGKDIYVGTDSYDENITDKINWLNTNQSQYRWHGVNTGGHADSTFCPVKPGLIVSLYDIPTYADTFPNWEVIYLPGQIWDSVLPSLRPFIELKQKNAGKWWVPGEELNDEFTNFVESWLSHWVGYVEETVFDVNMLVVDEYNVICNNYNEEIFKAFDRHGVTPHVVNFRHRLFWDGGLHCITSDISRRGDMKDYFPERRLGN